MLPQAEIINSSKEERFELEEVGGANKIEFLYFFVLKSAPAQKAFSYYRCALHR